jgi:rod shape-determining protein MreC
VQLAPILDIDLDPVKQRLVLDAGSRDGVRIGQAVIDAGGLMGQVIAVTPMHSTVLLLTDPDHAVPVTVARNGVRLIAYGRGDRARAARHAAQRRRGSGRRDRHLRAGRALPGRLPGGHGSAAAGRPMPSWSASWSRPPAGPRPRRAAVALGAADAAHPGGHRPGAAGGDTAPGPRPAPGNGCRGALRPRRRPMRPPHRQPAGARTHAAAASGHRRAGGAAGNRR